MSAQASPAESRTLLWRDGDWQSLEWCDPHEGEVLVADSWRVVNGQVRGLAAHRDRFLRSCAPHRDDATAFFADAVARIPREGDYFPRVELRASRNASTATELRLLVRPTPATAAFASSETAAAAAATGTVVVATAPRDVRTQPLIKGPDLAALAALRTAVQPLGAGEAVILSAAGSIVEGAYSGLLWWHDGVLHAPSIEQPRIESVTVRLILEAAQRAGVPVTFADATPADLAGCELWVLSALHGLRVATRWVDGPELTAHPARSAQGRVWLNEALTPLS